MLGCGHAQEHTTPSPSASLTPAATRIEGADAITADNCKSVAWLLTHYDLKRLASGSSPAPGTGFPLACCQPNALGNDNFRCQHDWPSSDVVDCSLWRDYYQVLSDAYTNAPQPAQVTQNLTLLEEWAKSGHHCMKGAQ